MTSNTKQRGTLDPWTMFRFDAETIRLVGVIHEDNRYDPKTTEFADGHRVITSPVLDLNVQSGRAQTVSGSVYWLGRRSNEFLTQLDQVTRERLLGNATEVFD